MPRARDLGIAIGGLPTGPTNSVLDVEGVGLGHVTITRETAMTGVSCLFLAQDAYPRPLVGGGAVLNGIGDCTGFRLFAKRIASSLWPALPVSMPRVSSSTTPQSF